jgi:hypothetical protein
MTLSVLMLLLTVLSPSDPGSESIGMVLRVEGEVILHRDSAEPKRATAMLLLHENDRLTTAVGASATIILFAKGIRERLLPGVSATILSAGSQPPQAIKRLDPLRAKVDRETWQSVTDLATGKGAVSVLRGAGHPVHPFAGATTLSDHPDFLWPVVKGATGYEIELLDANDSVLWKASAAIHETSYPATRPPLKRGEQYSWKVAALPDGSSVFSALQMPRPTFEVATQDLVDRLQPLENLAAGDEPADWLLAASVYQASGICERAVAPYEKYLQRCGDEPAVLSALSDCYTAAGRKDDAQEIRQRAKRSSSASPVE